MISGTRVEQGDVLIVPFPFTDLSAVKQRPVLVLSKENSGADIITCGITSNLKDTEHALLIDTQDLETGSLPTTSNIKVDKIFTLEKSIIRKRIGHINKRTLDLVREEFMSLV